MREYELKLKDRSEKLIKRLSFLQESFLSEGIIAFI